MKITETKVTKRLLTDLKALDPVTFIVDVDLSKFFDTVSHDVLMSRVSRKIRDKRLLKLIGRYLRAGVMIDGQCYPTRIGMPQGGPLSPLLYARHGHVLLG